MNSNKYRIEDLHKFFYDQTARDVTIPRHLWTGESWWCHCLHKVSEHKTISKSPFIARCSGSDASCPRNHLELSQLCKKGQPFDSVLTQVLKQLKESEANKGESKFGIRAPDTLTSGSHSIQITTKDGSDLKL